MFPRREHFIFRDRDNSLAVGLNRAQHYAGMRKWIGQRLPKPGIPDAGGAVGGSGHNPTAVR